MIIGHWIQCATTDFSSHGIYPHLNSSKGRFALCSSLDPSLLHRHTLGLLHHNHRQQEYERTEAKQHPTTRYADFPGVRRHHHSVTDREPTFSGEMTKVGRSSGAAVTTGPSKRSYGKLPVFDSDPTPPSLSPPRTASLASISPPGTPRSRNLTPAPVEHSVSTTPPVGVSSGSEPTPPTSSFRGEGEQIDYNDPAQFQRAVNESYDKFARLQRHFDDKERKKEFEQRVQEAAQTRFFREWGFRAPSAYDEHDPNALTFRPKQRGDGYRTAWRDFGDDYGSRLGSGRYPSGGRVSSGFW